MSMVAPGSRSDGLMTLALPQAKAMGNIHSGIMAGKLNLKGQSAHGHEAGHDQDKNPKKKGEEKEKACSMSSTALTGKCRQQHPGAGGSYKYQDRGPARAGTRPAAGKARCRHAPPPTFESWKGGLECLTLGGPHSHSCTSSVRIWAARTQGPAVNLIISIAVYLNAAQNIAFGVSNGLALLLGDELGQFALMLTQQILELEKHCLARDDGHVLQSALESLQVMYKERKGGEDRQ